MYPKNFARFYDPVYHQMRDSVDNEYFLNTMRRTKGRILEIGVGTGRLFMNAIKQGADIYGLDISPNMIHVLLTKLDPEQHHRISLQNMIDFSYDFRFDLAIAPFRVMMHLLEKEDQLAALNNVYRHLKPGGKFIFDTFIPDLNLLVSGMDRMTDFDGEYEPGKKLKRVVSTKPDLIRQQLHITFHLEWEEDSRLNHEDWEVDLRYFFRYELEHLVERSEFESYRISGDYEENEPDNDSKEFIVICEKL